jgi:oxalate decarboxylase
MTVFPGEEKARTMDFSANDVGYVSTMAGHYVQNTGDEDLVFLELFVAPEFQDISLNKWLRAFLNNAISKRSILPWFQP